MLDQALAVAGQHSPSADTRRRFWELFTGGDALFAPEPLAIPGDDHDQWAKQRYRLDRQHADLFTSAFQILDRSSPITLGKSLTWQPPQSLGGRVYQPTPPDGPRLGIDTTPFVIAHAILTLEQYLTPERKTAEAAQQAMTQRSGQ